MIKKDLINMYNIFEQLKQIKDVKFAYTIVKNKLKIKDEITAIQQISEPSKEYFEYESKRQKLIKEYCIRDEDGNVKMVNGFATYIPDKAHKAKEAVDNLIKEYIDVIKEQNKKEVEIQKILEEEIDIDFIKINFNDLPQEINAEQLEVLFPIIDDN